MRLTVFLSKNVIKGKSNYTNVKGEIVELSSFEDFYKEYVINPSYLKKKELGDIISPALFTLNECERRSEDISALCFIWFDIDQEEKHVKIFSSEEILNHLKDVFNGYMYAFYTTFSHTKEVPRFRVIMPISREITPEEYINISTYFTYKIHRDDANWLIKCDYSASRIAQGLLLPSFGDHNKDAFIQGLELGEAVDVDSTLEEIPRSLKKSVEIHKITRKPKNFQTKNLQNQDSIPDEILLDEAIKNSSFDTLYKLLESLLSFVSKKDMREICTMNAAASFHFNSTILLFFGIWGLFKHLDLTEEERLRVHDVVFYWLSLDSSYKNNVDSLTKKKESFIDIGKNKEGKKNFSEAVDILFKFFSQLNRNSKLLLDVKTLTISKVTKERIPIDKSNLLKYREQEGLIRKYLVYLDGSKRARLEINLTVIIEVSGIVVEYDVIKNTYIYFDEVENEYVDLDEYYEVIKAICLLNLISTPSKGETKDFILNHCKKLLRKNQLEKSHEIKNTLEKLRTSLYKGGISCFGKKYTIESEDCLIADYLERFFGSRLNVPNKQVKDAVLKQIALFLVSCVALQYYGQEPQFMLILIGKEGIGKDSWIKHLCLQIPSYIDDTGIVKDAVFQTVTYKSVSELKDSNGFALSTGAFIGQFAEVFVESIKEKQIIKEMVTSSDQKKRELFTDYDIKKIIRTVNFIAHTNNPSIFKSRSEHESDRRFVIMHILGSDGIEPSFEDQEVFHRESVKLHQKLWAYIAEGVAKRKEITNQQKRNLFTCTTNYLSVEEKQILSKNIAENYTSSDPHINFLNYYMTNERYYTDNQGNIVDRLSGLYNLSDLKDRKVMSKFIVLTIEGVKRFSEFMGEKQVKSTDFSKKNIRDGLINENYASFTFQETIFFILFFKEELRIKTNSSFNSNDLEFENSKVERFRNEAYIINKNLTTSRVIKSINKDVDVD